MAVDEVLLEGVCALSAYTLRFYRWRRPTVSLGYLQRWREGYDQKAADRLQFDVVRRLTGGRTVLHADELTYSLAGPAAEGPLAGGVLASYRRVALGLCAGLRRLGADVELQRVAGGVDAHVDPECAVVGTGADVEPERAVAGTGGHVDPERAFEDLCGDERPTVGAACFAARSRYEIGWQGRKLVGSAQRRRDGRLLQHGSMLLGRPDLGWWRALGTSGPQAASSSIGVAELLGGRPAHRVLVACLAEGIAEALGLPLRFGGLTRAERRAGARLMRRYSGSSWTRRR